MNTPRLLTLAGFIAAGAAFRLLPHPPNFTPIAAMALFGGAMLAPRLLGLLLPLGALVLSDLVLGFAGFAHVPYVYGSFVMIVGLGWLLQGRVSGLTVPAAAIGASVLFFLVTNFGVWAYSGMYPPTAAGLWASYVAALPFFTHTLAGDLFYSALLFGGLALAGRAFPVIQGHPA